MGYDRIRQGIDSTGGRVFHEPLKRLDLCQPGWVDGTVRLCEGLTEMKTFRIQYLALALFAILLTSQGIFMAPPATASDWSHPPLKVRKKTIQVGTGKDAEKVENVTAHCLECHGPDIGAKEADAEAPTPSHSVGGSDRSHPVDVAYPDSKSGLAPRTGLDKRLILIKGQVTCITCHDPEATDHALVIPSDGSQLCLACHQR